MFFDRSAILHRKLLQMFDQRLPAFTCKMFQHFRSTFTSVRNIIYDISIQFS